MEGAVLDKLLDELIGKQLRSIPPVRYSYQEMADLKASVVSLKTEYERIEKKVISAEAAFHEF